ncbi:MAG: hypothetical protein H0V20_06620 [Actinobacteria bacterium]|nr:hypothetical protein [Actinomycetota bacterium]
MPRPDALLDRAAAGLSSELASGITRRSFLGRVGAAVMTAMGGATVAAALAPEKAEAFHLCGHIWTTGSCPSPNPFPRIDRLGYPIRVSDGKPVDNLGRLIDGDGFPVNAAGERLRGPDGEALERGPRTRICEDWVPEQFGISAVTQGSWYRCCNGQIRKLVDCCSPSRRRINGDASLTGYCYTGRRVFCVMYYDTHLPC